MGRSIFSFILIVLLSPVVAWGQIDSENIQIWFEDSFEGGKLSLTANFLSLHEDFAILYFELESSIRKKEVFSNVENSKGEFLAAQNLPIPLATQTVDLENSEALIFTLRIFQDNQLLEKKKYTWLAKKDDTQRLSFSTNSEKEISGQKTKPNEKLPPSGSQPGLNENKASKPIAHAVDAFEIQGLIIDETRSKVGRDFYELFFRKWIPPANVSTDFTIKIKELPSFGRGGRVAVEINDQSLGQRNLSPRIDYIEAQVNASIRQARAYLTSRSKLRADLENEDQSGSGIY